MAYKVNYKVGDKITAYRYFNKYKDVQTSYYNGEVLTITKICYGVPYPIEATVDDKESPFAEETWLFEEDEVDPVI